MKTSLLSIAIIAGITTGIYFTQNNQTTDPPVQTDELCDIKKSLNTTEECAGEHKVVTSTKVVETKITDPKSEGRDPKADAKLVEVEKKKVVYRKPTEKIFTQTRVPATDFTIDNSKEAVINTDKGTMAVIPRNAFVDGDGKAVTGNVDIKLREVLTKSDILLSNVPTMSNGRLLETNGSMEIRAYANGEELALAEGKSIYVELPTDNRLSGMSIWNGQYTEVGDMNWEETGQLSKDMFTMPFDQLDLKGVHLDDGVYSRITSPKNEGTYLATREFEQRFQSIHSQHELHQRTNEVMEFYLKNTHMDLATVDKKVVNYLSDLGFCTPFVNQFHEDSPLLEEYSAKYNSFKQEDLRKENLVQTYGVTEINDQAMDKLLSVGLSKSEAEMLLSRIQTRDAIIARRAEIRVQKDSIRAERSRREAAQRGAVNAAAYEVVSNNFNISELGWINCDRFRQNTRTTQLMTKAAEGTEAWTESFIVFRDLQSIMSGSRDKDGKYTFFRNTPIGEPAILVTIGIEGKKTYVGIKEIVTGQREVEEVVLKEASIAAIEDEMLALN